MKKSALSIGIFLIIVNLAACTKKETVTDTSSSEKSAVTPAEKVQAETIKELPAVWAKSYTMDMVNKEICHPESAEDIAACTLYDVQSIKTNVDWLNQYYDAQLKEIYAKNAFGAKNTFKLEGEDAERKYYEGSMVGFDGQRYNLVTFTVFHNSYSGGAHNNYNLKYDVFDLKTKKKLSLNDVLKPVAKAQVLALMKEYNQDNLTEYQTDLDTLELTENFYFGANGLVFVYAPYEIAAWVYGMPELTVPYDELEDLIKPEYIPDRPDGRISREFS